MWRIVFYVFCGAAIDLLVTLYYRFIILGRAGLASLFAMLITIATYAILDRIVVRWNTRLVLAYGIGTAVGTWIGMKIF